MTLARPRLGLLFDYLEEGWPSMELVADMLLRSMQGDPASPFEATRIGPAFRRRFTRLPWIGRRSAARNADRLLNRFRYYPRFARGLTNQYDFFHVCDHSYSQLVHALPPERTGVYCHDLDTFRCLLQPEKEPRPWWFRRMMQRTLDGFRKAAVVFHSTHEVGRQIMAHKLIDPEKLVHAPYGVAPEFSERQDSNDVEPLPNLDPAPFLLHVGSCIERKRIDVLLDVFAAVRRQQPHLRLIQVGGEWTTAQRSQIDRLGIGSYLRQVRGLSRATLAALYRRAAVVLQTSEAEGFGLPIIEALACGAVFVASDISVLREVGGAAIRYAPVADIAIWAETVNTLLRDPSTAPVSAIRALQASKYSWEAHARTIADAYLRLAGRVTAAA